MLNRELEEFVLAPEIQFGTNVFAGFLKQALLAMTGGIFEPWIGGALPKRRYGAILKWSTDGAYEPSGSFGAWEEIIQP